MWIHWPKLLTTTLRIWSSPTTKPGLCQVGNNNKNLDCVRWEIIIKTWIVLPVRWEIITVVNPELFPSLFRFWLNFKENWCGLIHCWIRNRIFPTLEITWNTGIYYGTYSNTVKNVTFLQCSGAGARKTEIIFLSQRRN